MPTLTGVILEKVHRTTQSGKEAYDLRVGAPNAQYGTKITDWMREDGTYLSELYDDGDSVTVVFEERPAPNNGKYRNLTGIQPGTGPQPTPTQPAPSQPRQEARSAGQGAPAPKESGGGWREAYSQSREAQEAQRASIEAQTALKEAWEFVRDLVRVEKMDPANVAILRERLVDFTLAGLYAMRKARENQETR